MRKVLVFAGVAIVAVLAAAGITFHSTAQRKAVEPPVNQLRWDANEAKKAGKSGVTVRFSLLHDFPDFDDALGAVTVVRARVIGRKSLTEMGYNSTDGNNMYTWNRLQILETLSEPKQVTTIGQFPVPARELEQLNRGEVLLFTYGGIMNIDGVEVVQAYNLKQGQEYLMYLLLYSNGMARLPKSAASVFAVEPDGKLTPFVDGGVGPFDKLGDSLEAVRTKINQRKNK